MKKIKEIWDKYWGLTKRDVLHFAILATALYLVGCAIGLAILNWRC